MEFIGPGAEMAFPDTVICVFYFQTWNRVVIKDVDPLQKKAHVLYIDYGNEEKLPVDRIHRLNRNIDLFPPCVSFPL